MKKSVEFRKLLDQGRIVVAPGATTALFGYLVEQAGFDVVYATGAGIANMNFGLPDINLVSMNENLEIIKRINDATTIPLVADIDNGYGTAVSVYRTVREFTALGVAGLQMEDQKLPKRCGHFENKGLISKEEMVGKIKAAKDASLDPDMVLIARTDAMAVKGFDEALERAAAYKDAGADMIFVEAPTTVEMLRAIPQKIKSWQMANIVEGGKTPLVSNAELEAMGFNFVIYANAPLKAAVKGIKDILTHLKKEGTTDRAENLMITMRERNEITKLADWDALSSKYSDAP
jgi:2-methylisocitrate lyase-like PEP mutase family enzyme